MTKNSLVTHKATNHATLLKNQQYIKWTSQLVKLCSFTRIYACENLQIICMYIILWETNHLLYEIKNITVKYFNKIKTQTKSKASHVVVQRKWLHWNNLQKTSIWITVDRNIKPCYHDVTKQHCISMYIYQTSLITNLEVQRYQMRKFYLNVTIGSYIRLPFSKKNPEHFIS